MISTVSLVALGGAIGAACRHLVGLFVLRVFGGADFPVAILSVNVVGSFLMGVCVMLFHPKQELAHLAPFFMTGLLGGFTTFSAFSLDVVAMMERGQMLSAGLYIALSVGLSVGALMLGLWIGRGVVFS